MQFTAVTPKQAKAEFAIVGVTTDADGDRAAPGLGSFGLADHEHATWLIGNKDTSLGPGQCISIPTGTTGLCLVGLGDPSKLTMEKLGTYVNHALDHIKGIGFGEAATSLVTDASHADGLTEAQATKALVEGAIIGQLRFDQWHGKGDGDDDKGVTFSKLQLVHDKPASIRSAVKAASTIGHATNDARLLANTPANVCTPKWLASEARKRGRKHGFKVTVKGRAALRKEGYGGLCGVGQGSDNEEQLIVMDYPGSGAKSTKTIVIVGKAVTFDSGGISIKPGNLMWEMKYDKCGGCNVVALMTTLKDLGVKHRVVGIVPAAENMPGGRAQRPGDIITTKKGTTVEVLNTDAEGRLILADAIHYGTTYKPAWMCDMATLTGACDFAVGSTYVAVMSKDDELAQSFIDASHAAGDKAWRLPQGEEFDKANKGTYADLQNISLSNKAGTAIGGSFVGHFAGDIPFAHLDIASKAWTKKMDYFGNGPTGAGMRIVLQRILNE